MCTCGLPTRNLSLAAAAAAAAVARLVPVDAVPVRRPVPRERGQRQCARCAQHPCWPVAFRRTHTPVPWPTAPTSPWCTARGRLLMHGHQTTLLTARHTVTRRPSLLCCLQRAKHACAGAAARRTLSCVATSPALPQPPRFGASCGPDGRCCWPPCGACASGTGIVCATDHTHHTAAPCARQRRSVTRCHSPCV
jgi:hypothetical protein